MTPSALPLPPSLAGRLDILAVEECDSTSSVLRRLAPSLLRETVLTASRQTAGRGRMGRSFYSPGGTGLYMSVLVRPKLAAADIPLLTPAAAVAVCGAIEEVSGVRADIKWVNDVYISGKKVCGILTESALGPEGSPLYCVVGIGVNVSPPPGGFPGDIADVAGAVFDSCPPGVLPELAAGILLRFFDLLDSLPDLSFVEEYRARSMLIGQSIWVIRDEEKLPANVTGVDSRCGLTVEYPDGSAETLTSGEVTVRVR